MVQNSNLMLGSSNVAAIGKSALVGWCIGFAAISFFVFGVDHANPEWGQYWQVRPLVLTPIASAFGGAVFSVLRQAGRPGWGKLATTAVGVLLFIASLWIGTVLGLVGTMWN